MELIIFPQIDQTQPRIFENLRAERLLVTTAFFRKGI
jgi:hypothetical protein